MWRRMRGRGTPAWGSPRRYDGAVRAADIVPLKGVMTRFLETLTPDD